MSNQVLIRAETDGEVIRLWLGDKASQLTQKTYLCAVEQFFDFVGVDIKGIRLEDLMLWKMALLARHRIATVRAKLSVVKSLLSFCSVVGYTESNVGKLIKLPKEENKVSEKLLTREEVQTLVQACQTQRDRVLIAVMYSLGLRVTEARLLRWEDFYLVGHQRKVKIIGKGQKQRDLPVSPNLWQVLASIKEGFSEGLVFRSYRGNKPLNRSRIHKILKDAAALAGLTDKVSAHWFRHSYATESIVNGKADIARLQARMGHSKITTTARYFALVGLDDTEEFVPVPLVDLSDNSQNQSV